MARSNLGALLKQMGDLNAAEKILREAVHAMRKALGDTHTATISSVTNLGLVLERQGDVASAEALLREAAQASENIVGPSHPQTAACLTHLGSLLENRGDLEAALGVHSQVLTALEATERQEGTRSVASHVAALLQRVGRGAQADALLTKHRVYG